MKTPKELALLAARALSDKKGKEIRVMEIAELTTLADYFVLATGASNTQINALVDNVEKVLALTGCNQFHSSASGTSYDTSTANSRGIFFGGSLYPPEDHFSVTNSQVVSRYCEMIK